MVDFSVYGQPMARTAPLNESMLSLPSDADLAVMGMTAQQFADLQNSIGNISLSNTPILSGPLDLIGGSSPYSRTINEFDYMVGAPLSNKGNPTSTLRQSSNDFFVYDNQKVRLVDNKTGQVIFEGAGPADAKKASDMAPTTTPPRWRPRRRRPKSHLRPKRLRVRPHLTHKHGPSNMVHVFACKHGPIHTHMGEVRVSAPWTA